MHLKDVFNQYSQDYDANRRHFIPLYDTFYQSAIDLLNFDTDTPKVLDLGAGTGLMSAFVLAAYPKAQITLIDQAQNMLDLAKQRFEGRDQMHYIADDYTSHTFDEKYDAIVSALSIHHLEDDKKRKLFKSCFSSLTQNGIFVNADQVLSPDPELEEQIIGIWHDFVRKSDVTEEELAAYYHRTSFDQTAPLNDELAWLLSEGFSKADCIFKYLNFAVFFAIK
ncbi:class I SAM-dependent methyltransferase [Acetobacterium carbinolicum]|jgi:tRNA (cmo5U34)-methyltransferase|uniref:class I SAM-dependent methyltransferase n=1 Tax=Acetobacterium carbinolicum TaxID=52690 RepID=UPI0039C97541